MQGKLQSGGQYDFRTPSMSGGGYAFEDIPPPPKDYEIRKNTVTKRFFSLHNPCIPHTEIYCHS